MSGLQPSVAIGTVTQPYGLGWYMAAPLALNQGKGNPRHFATYQSTELARLGKIVMVPVADTQKVARMLL
jgi:hypothetical protein